MNPKKFIIEIILLVAVAILISSGQTKIIIAGFVLLFIDGGIFALHLYFIKQHEAKKTPTTRYKPPPQPTYQNQQQEVSVEEEPMQQEEPVKQQPIQQKKVEEIHLSHEDILKLYAEGNIERIQEFYGQDGTRANALPPEFATKVVLGIIPFDYSDHVQSNYNFSQVPDEIFFAIIRELSGYELMGYRVQPIDDDEETSCTITDFEASDDNNDVDFEFYNDVDYDIIRLFEEHDIKNPALRKASFDKIISESKNLVDVINRWDTVTPYETEKICRRSFKEEIEALIDHTDSDNILPEFPISTLIQAKLGLLDVDVDDEWDRRWEYDQGFVDKVNRLISAL